MKHLFPLLPSDGVSLVWNRVVFEAEASKGES